MKLRQRLPPKENVNFIKIEIKEEFPVKKNIRRKYKKKKKPAKESTAFFLPYVEIQHFGIEDVVDTLSAASDKDIALIKECEVLYECKLCGYFARSISSYLNHVTSACAATLERNDKESDEWYSSTEEPLSSIADEDNPFVIFDNFLRENPSVPKTSTLNIVKCKTEPEDDSEYNMPSTSKTINTESETKLVEKRLPQSCIIKKEQISPTECQFCQACFATPGALRMHKRDLHSNTVIAYRCPCCDVFLQSLLNWEKHLLTKHKKKREFLATLDAKPTLLQNNDTRISKK